MKVPQTFLPEGSLDKKVEQLLDGVKSRKSPDRDTKRKVFIYQSGSYNFDDEAWICAQVKYSLERKGYFLKVYSNGEFYFPVCDNPIDWGPRMRKDSTAFLKNERSLIGYFMDLQQNNKAELIWQRNDYILRFKKKFEKRFYSN